MKREQMGNVQTHAPQSINLPISLSDKTLEKLSSRTLVNRIRNRSKLESALKEPDIKMGRPRPIWRVHYHSVIFSFNLIDIRYKPFDLNPGRHCVLSRQSDSCLIDIDADDFHGPHHGSTNCQTPRPGSEIDCLTLQVAMLKPGHVQQFNRYVRRNRVLFES